MRDGARWLGWAVSAVLHGGAGWAVLTVAMSRPPEPPQMLDLAMPAIEDAPAQTPPQLETAQAVPPEATQAAAPPPPEAAREPPPERPAEVPPDAQLAEAPPPDPEPMAEPPPEEPIALADPLPDEPPPPPPPPAPPPPPVRAARPPAPPRPQTVAAPAAPVAAAAPIAAAAAGPPPTWLGEISAALRRHQTYPAGLRAMRIGGLVMLRFTMDRGGQVTARRVERSSGNDEIDRLALELLAKAAPLPQPPADLAGASFELVVPVRYTVR